MVVPISDPVCAFCGKPIPGDESPVEAATDGALCHDACVVAYEDRT